MKAQSITEIHSPADERRDRMVKYGIAMSIRLACIVACVFVQGWWLLLCVAGAVVLPYIAVVLANTHSSTARERVSRPGGLLRVDRDRRPR